MWCPPTPPQDDNDIYVDHALGFLYEQEVIPEEQLPAVYVKKDYKRSRLEAGFFTDGRRQIKMRKEDHFYAPRSLFDRPAPALAKMRRDLKLQRYRGICRPLQLAGLKPQFPIKPLVEPEGMAEWSIHEDMVILNVIQNLQLLPLNLILLSPGHTPNWDLVAELVNQTSRTYRSPKQCRYRYEALIVPREEGKLMDSPKKQKKNKGLKSSPMKRTLRTAQQFQSDNNASFSKFARSKFDIIKNVFLKKSPQLKQVLVNPTLKNPKHVQLLAEFGINSFDGPLTPQDIAAKRIERITKEKQKTAMLQNQQDIAAASQPTQQIIQVQPSQVVQTQSQPQSVQQAIVVQQGTGTQVAALVQGGQIQVSRPPSAVVQAGPHSSQIVKAIVATAPAQQILGGTVQQITLSDRGQPNQLQSSPQQTSFNPNSVSVVLSSPVTSVSTVQVAQPQIVSIQSPVVSSGTIVSQGQSIIQTASSQSQVVSVAQLATLGVSAVSTVPTAGTLTTQSLRPQRIMASTLQEVVLHQRQPGSQSPTVVSVSGLNQNQISAMRLSMGAGQQVSNVVAKTIPVGTVVSAGTGKPGTQQIQFYRQPVRQQQLKVMHTSTGQAGQTTVVQSAGGQTALVGPTGIVTNIQGNLIQTGQTVQVQGGQKVAVASVSGAVSNAQTVTTVQMAPGQPRTQFVKPVGGKQIGRQVGDGEMQAVMVKRPIIGQHKTQMIPQAQIFTSNVQVQQAGGSAPQVATLVKTSSGTLTAGVPLSQVKTAQLKTAQMNTAVRQIQLHQPLQIAQQRKGGKVTQIAQIGGKTTLPTQLIVQNAKPGTVTVQQIQPVFRHAQPGTITTAGQIMLGKNVSRMIPVSVASQPNQRQTIQVVTGSPGAGNLRAHVATGQNFQGVIQGAIKVAAAPQQQAILTALQNSGQRTNASPVRLQTSGGSLVAVTVQQSPNTTSNQSQSGSVVNDMSQQGGPGQQSGGAQNQQGQGSGQAQQQVSEFLIDTI